VTHGRKTMARARRTRTSRGSPQHGDWTSSDGSASLSPDEPLTLTVYLRHRKLVRRRPGSGIDLAELTVRVSCEELEAERTRILKRPVEQVRRFAEQHGMTVLDVNLLRRCVWLRAKAADAERAFATKLMWVDADGERWHCPAGKPKIPQPLADIAHAVVGLDTRPPKFGKLSSHVEPDGSNGLYPSEIARLYGITTTGRGAGQCIGIIAPAGGYDPDDIAASCKAMNVPVPKIDDIGVSGGQNVKPADPPSNFDKEVALDIQVVAGIAPQARLAVYFTQRSQPELVAGVSEAVHGSRARPNIIVITWGQPEESWDPEARKGLDAVLQDAVRLGITVVASSGDDLATDGFRDASGVPDGVHVDYPASSPYVLGCGGTQITLDDAQTRIVNEVVWNDRANGTGGGVSVFYAVPDFQNGVTLPASLNDGKRGRGVPDVAAAAAGTNGYRIILRNKEFVNGGTSAVAPLWGAFIALLNEQRGAALGYAHQRLYQVQRSLNRITSGDNKDSFLHLGYQAAPDGSWNACTGLGTPNGAAIIAALTAVA
jgi:kumamolisin